METLNDKKKRKLAFPETSLLLLIMIFLMGILTYVMPAGVFDRMIDPETEREIVVAGSYHAVEQSPIAVGALFASVFNGLVRASEIIALIFVVGGAFGVVSKSGAIAATLGHMIKKLEGRESIVIAIMMTAFAICGATFGMAEESLPFVVILVVVSLKMGFDPIVGVAMVCLGLYCGYSPGPLNPFNTGIAQGIAELPTFSGMGLRLVAMAGALVIAITGTILHGKKYKREGHDNSKLMAMYNVEDERPITNQDKLIMVVLGITIATLIYGVIQYGWYLQEICALFFAMGIVVGIINHRGNANQIARDFMAGAGEMTTAAIFVGLSRAILVVMEDGMIMDTLVYYLSLPLENLNNIFAAWGMYISQGFINFFIPSSSGQAAVVMPILSPLADLVGVSRQTTVLAYQFGDGFWNMITPTHSVMMASLGLAKVSFGKWFKFAVKIVAAWTVWVFIVLAVAVITGYGPF